MSDCTNGELRDLLPELVNGRLDAETRQSVEAHIASCAECADELALLRALRPALMREPAIDAQRIAAAVRAQTAGTARSASRAPARQGTATRWRVAIAAGALLAIGALGYVANVHRMLGAPEVAVAPTSASGVRDTGTPPSAAAETAHAPIVAPAQEIAVAPSHPTPSAPTTVASTGVVENVSDLSDDEVRALTASLDTLSSVPDADPSPGIDPLGASLEDLSAGGR
jgi:anti-sigma factor RsiW